MKSVEADFSEPSAPPRWLWRTLAASGFLACGLAAWALQQRHALTEMRERDAAIARAASQVVPEVPARQQALPPYQASAQRLLHEHAAPWPAALSALEAQRVPGVVVISLDYSAPDSNLRVEVSAGSIEGVLKLAEELNRRRPTSDPAAFGEHLEWIVARTMATDAGRVQALLHARRASTDRAPK